MRKVQKAESSMQNDSKSLKIHSLEKLKGRSEKYSAAADCKRILEQDDGGKGMKSSVKSEKRERNRGIKDRYWHLREEFEKLSDFKCATVKIEEEGTTFKDLYHYYTCPEMGQGRACLRRVPCNCTACDEKIRLPWVHGLVPKEQPRFAPVTDCYLKSILEQKNNWHFVELVESKSVSEEEADEIHADVLHYVTTAVAENIVVGGIGAVSTRGNDADDGYYLVEFTGLPYTDQTFEASLKCEANWLYSLPGAPKWYYKSTTTTTIDVMHLLMADVEMIPYSPANMPSARARSQANEVDAMKISEDSHHFVADEILRRNRLEYDPSRVYDEEDEEDEDDVEAD